jgi:NAD(P)-dependent dehydrogenase (short-subunit alcohol dehydrogenase family)
VELTGKRILITGAASGIGRALAQAAGRDGAQLVLTDRNVALLDQTAAELRDAGTDVAIAQAADVSDFAQVQALAKAVHEQGGSVDVVMNVAGIAVWGTVDRLEHQQWRKAVDVNLMGPIHVIECFVPQMIEARRGGHIVNVSSAAGLLGLPWHAPYSASKFGLRGVSEVLRFDLRRHHIRVHLVCPGGVATPLTSTVEIAGVDTSGQAFTRMQAHFRKRAVSPEQAAEAILRGMRRNRYLVYTSRDIQFAYLLQRVFPPAYNLIMQAMNVAIRRALPVTRP